MKKTIRAKIIHDRKNKKNALETIFLEYKNTVKQYLNVLLKEKPLQKNRKFLMILLEKKVLSTPLPSALRQSARDKSIEIYKGWRKTKGKFPEIRKISIRYDKRSYRILRTKTKLSSYFVSLLTLEKRKILPIRMAKYQENLLKEWKITSSELTRNNGNYFLNIVIEKEIQPLVYTPQTVIGVDLGIRNLCVLSSLNSGKRETFFLKDGRLKHKLFQLREQYKKAKTNKRKVRIGRKIRRINNYYAHKISSWIIKHVEKQSSPIVVFENLKGFYAKKGKRRKDQNYLSSMWLRGRVVKYAQYKAEEKGILTTLVNPHNTSITCPKCNHIDSKNRNGINFLCKNCNYSNNADRIGSLNIALKYKGISSGPKLPENMGYSDLAQHSNSNSSLFVRCFNPS